MTKTKIYTRTGDKGETSLFTGERVPKNNEIIEAIGSVDECNCAIGMAIALFGNREKLIRTKQQLEIIQHALFDVGAALATPRTRAIATKLNKTHFDHEATALLEKWIDQMELELPELHAFILPGGDPCGGMLHLARSICRKAERLAVPLNKKAEISDHVMTYLNRLSDYLFVASRFVNHLLNVPETIWEQHKIVNV